jgi:glycosyltransferase involved in cell wall biosynthesis
VEFKNKTILIISPQAWGNMFLAKHHYAIELAKLGNKVFFLNPVGSTKKIKGIKIEETSEYPNLKIIYHSLFFPYQLKFKWMGMFHFLMQFHIRKIFKKIGTKIDIVWSFDLGNYFPFKHFNTTSYKIFHPIDEPLTKAAISSANGANIIFSVTSEILAKYHKFKVPKHFIHHGLAEEFLQYNANEKKEDTIRVGMSGNWLRPDVDHTNLLKIINSNPLVQFELWGTYKAKDSNIGGEHNTMIDAFIKKLQNCKNVVLHGAVDTTILAKEFQRMDAFLICYDIEKDQSKGTNYHKVMEYLSTGKVVIANNISTYEKMPDLVEMTKSRNNNNELPILFYKTISALEFFNQPEKKKIRIEFAFSNSYRKQVKEIEKLILSSSSLRK